MTARTVLARAAAAAALIAGLAGCDVRQAMYNQPRLEPYQASEFFADGRASRDPVEGTVAVGHLHEDAHLYTGLVDGQPATSCPFAVTQAVMERGQERYNIYCAPCHDRAGTGHGMVVQRGFKAPPSFHDERLRASPPGYFFGVITKGFGVMSDHAMQLAAEDRWAVAAYIRALQLSRNGRIEDVPPADRAALEAAK